MLVRCFLYVCYLAGVLLLPVSAYAAPVDVGAVASGVFDQALSVSLVGAAVLLLFGALAALRYVRQVMGVGSVSASAAVAAPTAVPSVRGYSSAQEYLDSLASRLAAEDARGYDRETGEVSLSSWDEDGRYVDQPVVLGVAGDSGDLAPTYREATPEEAGSWARINDAHDAADERVDFKEKDFAPPLTSAETASLDAFEASYTDMWASQSQRAEAEASGADMALYDRFISEDATHEEALRWSNKAANAEIKMPALGSGWQ